MQYSSRLLALLTAATFVAAPAFAAEEEKAAEAPKPAAEAPPPRLPFGVSANPADLAIAVEDIKAVTVNGVTIPAEVIQTMIKMQLARGMPNTEENRQKIIDNLVNQQLLMQEAKRTGLDKEPETAKQLEMAQYNILTNVLANAYVKNYLEKNPVSDDTLKEQYEKMKASVSGNEYHARHILVEDEKTATDLIAKLGKGEKFEDLAKAHSKDTGSKESGGDLGWAKASMYVPPFSEALKKLKKGELTKEPVKTDFGFHVIELINTRSAEPPPYGQVEPQLKRAAELEAVEKMVKGLKDKAKIE